MKKHYHLVWIGCLCLILGLTLNGRRTRANSAMPFAADPAALLPADTLFYLEIRDVVTVLDMLSERACWPEMTALAEDLAVRMEEFVGLREICRQWPADDALRRQFRDVAGERIVVAVISTGATPAKLVALRGAASAPSARRVAGLFRLLDWPVRVDEKAHTLHGTGTAGEMAWTGRPVGEWFVLAPDRDAAKLAATLAVLAGRRDEDKSLAGLASFADSVPDLPGPFMARGFVNTQGLALELARHDLTERPAARLLLSLLCRMDGLAFARQIEPDGIVTRMVGRIHPVRAGDPVWSLVSEAVPLTDHGRRAVPAGALGVYETSLPVSRMAAALQALLEEASLPPDGHWGPAFDELDMAAGFGLVEDLLPVLGDGLTAALLRGGLKDGTLALPQPLVIIPVRDEEAARVVMDDLLAWKAGSVAPSTHGLLGARVVSGEYEGVELRGLQLEGLLPVQFFSPTCAVTDGLLIFSPFREGVCEAITTLHEGRPAWSSAENRPGGDVSSTGSVVEAGVLDMAGLGAVMLDLARLCPQTEQSAGSFWSLTGRLLQTFGTAQGKTTVDTAGRFSCEFNVSFGRNRSDDPTPPRHAP